MNINPAGWSLDNSPELHDIILDLLDVHFTGGRLRLRHLFDVGVEFPDFVTNNLRVDFVPVTAVCGAVGNVFSKYRII
jgi:hypothetical protein